MIPDASFSPFLQYSRSPSIPSDNPSPLLYITYFSMCLSGNCLVLTYNFAVDPHLGNMLLTLNQ